MLSLRKRAFVALGTIAAALGATLAIAPAAHAATLTTQSLTTSFGTMTVQLTTDLNNNVYEEVWVTNNLHDGNNCVEGWADVYLIAHRPANGFPNCITGTYDSGAIPLNWPRSDGGFNGPNGAVIINDLSRTDAVKMALCELNVSDTPTNSWFVRYDSTDGGPCTEGAAPNGPVGAIHNASYDAMSWLNEQNIAYPCSGCSVDMRPQYTNRGNIDLGFNRTNEVLHYGDMLVSYDGSHRATAGAGGSFNVWNSLTGTETWMSVWCHAPFKGTYADDYMVFQNDGNEVLYSAANGAQWASANLTAGYPSPCPSTTGAFSSDPGLYTVMQSDGNLVEYPHPGAAAIWATNTSGR